MARKSSPIEFSALSKGFVSDSSPLNYQPDSASTLENFNLNLNGTITRRGGLNKVLPTFNGNLPYESTYLTTDLGDTISDYYDYYRGRTNAYIWSGAGESASDTILVFCNPESRLSFYLLLDTGLEQISVPTGNNMLTLQYNGLPNTSPYSKVDFTTNGTKMSVCNGGTFIYSVEYKGGAISFTSSRLKVRDIWGIYDTLTDGTDLTGEGSKVRPNINYTTNSTEEEVLKKHLYNLMNQGWADMITELIGTALEIPSVSFKTASSAKYGADDFWPSNADSVVDYTYPNTSATPPTIDRYHAEDHVQSRYDNSRAPQGHYVIDLIDRSTSRGLEYNKTAAVYVDRGKSLASPWQSPPSNMDGNSFGGPSSLASFAGRVWYSGISNAGITDDWDGAPDLSKLVLFSQLADSDSAASRCYQSGDPTSKDNPDIIDTDGGLILLPEAEVILKLTPVGDSLIVVASNGVWAIDGGDSGFTATNYRVNKISSVGCISGGSVTTVEDTLMYFSSRGIMQISRDEVGAMTASDISTGRIGNFYSQLTTNELITCSGNYDSVSRDVSWNFLSPTQAVELRLSLDVNAYYKYVWQGSLSGHDVLPIMNLPISGSLKGVRVNQVLVGGVDVVSNGELVGIESGTSVDSPVSSLRVIQQYNTATPFKELVFGFAIESLDNFNDWESFETTNDADPTGNPWDIPTPVDSPATIVTGYLVGGDTQRYKTVPMLTMLFNKTEDGFEEDVLGDLYPTNPSSCKVQAQWEWTNSANSGRWGREFQGYRHRRYYIPEDGADQYEDGHSVVTTKNKLRGKGRALSLKMTTEPDKDCQILGWSFNMSIGDAV